MVLYVLISLYVVWLFVGFGMVIAYVIRLIIMVIFLVCIKSIGSRIVFNVVV